jgi:diguanylate cyclase (GGDEF)-like protein
MRRVAEGDYKQRVAHPGLSEINDLADSFNEMLERLEKRSYSLQAEMAARDRAEQRITYQAHHDALTGLPSRLLLKDRLDTALADARRTGEPLAVMFLDLDHFKQVNDSAGHSSGDELLVGVADRILSTAREGDSVARVGGDEYVVLLPRVSGPEAAVGIATRIQDSLGQPWELRGRGFRVTASIGIAMHPGDGVDAETLLRNADTALYRAKADGRDAIRVFSPEMGASIQERMHLEHDLRVAFQLDRFVLHYQPQVDTASGRIVGLEALLRWQDPDRGLVPPSEFIHVAEETGLIWDLGRWVLGTACRQVQSWRASGLVDRLPIAVNVSAHQFQDVGIVDVIRDTLDATGLPSELLELELTESTAMRDVEHSVRTLAQLKEMGIRLSIDDFGTGYSSLVYLKRFPVDTVKIDRSFIMDVGRHPDDTAIVGAIIALAESLSMNSVAEGVETAEQLRFLKERRCTAYQGFIFSPALPADELARLLARESEPDLEGVGGTPLPVRPGLAFVKNR